MVGTNPTVRPAARARCRAPRQSAAVSSTRSGTGYTAAGTVGAADSANWVARAAPAW